MIRTLLVIFLLPSVCFSGTKIHAGNDELSLNTSANQLFVMNKTVQRIYKKERNHYKQTLLKTFPVIVARFSNDGGHLTLYRPEQKPLVAKAVPPIYLYTKSVAHAIMITVVASNTNLNTSEATWRPMMEMIHNEVTASLSTLNQLDISDDEKKVFKKSLMFVNTYLLTCLEHRRIEKKQLNHFVKTIRPYITKLIAIAANAQIKHQMQVLAQWKKLLGKDFTKTYAMTNTIYVTRQNNILFSMLAEFMGKDAINHRLFLFETTTFTTTDENLLDLWSRIIFDRDLSMTLFDNQYLMDSELLANGGKQIIIDEARKYNLPNLLPPNEPFNSTGWPWRHNPHEGSGISKQEYY